MGKINSQIFEMEESILIYEYEKSILLCKNSENNTNRWIKKINDINSVDNVIEDPDKFYVSCESHDINGYYLALNKNDGTTEWFIPGKALFQIIFEEFLYLIFVDERMNYYLLKVDRTSGNKIWYHKIDEDLMEYSFRSDRILLTYASGRNEKVSPQTGLLL